MQEHGKRKKKQKHTAETGRTENPPRGEREATRPKRKQGTKSGPRSPKKNQRNAKITRENAERRKPGISLRNEGTLKKPSLSVSLATSHKGITKPPRRFDNPQHLSQSSKKTKNNSKNSSYEIPAPILSVESSYKVVVTMLPSPPGETQKRQR